MKWADGQDGHAFLPNGNGRVVASVWRLSSGAFLAGVARSDADYFDRSLGEFVDMQSAMDAVNEHFRQRAKSNAEYKVALARKACGNPIQGRD
jgi:hypothetical protein